MQVKEHALATIARTGSLPMQKEQIKLESRDDRVAGTMLAAEVMAYAKGNSKQWLRFAWNIVDLTVEARAVFIGELRKDKAAMTKAQTEAGFDGKYAKTNTNSFATMLGNLSAIANAFNSGATVLGLIEHINTNRTDKRGLVDEADARDNLGFDPILQYSRLFGKSKAGRPSDDWITKLGKFLERTKPEDTDEAGLKAYDLAVIFYKGLAKA